MRKFQVKWKRIAEFRGTNVLKNGQTLITIGTDLTQERLELWVWFVYVCVCVCVACVCCVCVSVCGWAFTEATNWSRHFDWVWWGMYGHVQSSFKWWVSNISRMSWGMKVFECSWIYNKFIQAFQLRVVEHAQGCPKHFKMINWQYLKNHSS